MSKISELDGIRAIAVSIVFVARMGDNDQMMTLLDSIVDAFADHLDSYAHVISASWWSEGAWSEETIQLSDETSTAGVRWTFTPLTSARGRASHL